MYPVRIRRAAGIPISESGSFTEKDDCRLIGGGFSDNSMAYTRRRSDDRGGTEKNYNGQEAQEG